MSRAKADAADTRALAAMLPEGEDPSDYMIGSSSGLPVRKLPPTLDEVDADTLLDKLAAIALRATKGGGLPTELADKLQALADAARTHGPLVDHPKWCDPKRCFSEDDLGTLVVGHNAVLMEEYATGDAWVERGEDPEVRVQLLRFENYAPDGSVDSEGTVLFVDQTPDGEWAGGRLQRFAHAVSTGALLAAADPPASLPSPDEVFEVVPRRVFHFAGDPNGPGARGCANPD